MITGRLLLFLRPFASIFFPLTVGSEEAPIEGLASVRRSNGTCRFPAFRLRHTTGSSAYADDDDCEKCCGLPTQWVYGLYVVVLVAQVSTLFAVIFSRDRHHDGSMPSPTSLAHID